MFNQLLQLVEKEASIVKISVVIEYRKSADEDVNDSLHLSYFTGGPTYDEPLGGAQSR